MTLIKCLSKLGDTSNSIHSTSDVNTKVTSAEGKSNSMGSVETQNTDHWGMGPYWGGPYWRYRGPYWRRWWY